MHSSPMSPGDLLGAQEYSLAVRVLASSYSHPFLPSNPANRKSVCGLFGFVFPGVLVNGTSAWTVEAVSAQHSFLGIVGVVARTVTRPFPLLSSVLLLQVAQQSLVGGHLARLQVGLSGVQLLERVCVLLVALGQMPGRVVLGCAAAACVVLRK